MPVEAHMNPAWAGRWLLIATVLLVFAGWYGYDAAIGYPSQNRAAATQDEDLPYSRQEIATQWIIAGACSILAAAVLLNIALHARRTWSADDQRLRGPGGLDITFDRITAIDRSRWDSKGIATLHYQTGTSQPRRIKLDAWVYRGAESVLAEVERHTGLGDTLAI